MNAEVVIEVDLVLATGLWIDKDVQPESKLKFYLVGPDGRAGDPTIVSFPAVDGRKNTSVHSSVNFHKIRFRGLGLYTVELEMREKGERRWKKVASYPLDMRLMGASSTSL